MLYRSALNDLLVYDLENAMAVYAKRITGKWKRAFTQLERISGFEPMFQDEIDRGEITLTQAFEDNLKWLEDVVGDCQNIPRPGTGN
jgi:hypothetical protein